MRKFSLLLVFTIAFLWVADPTEAATTKQKFDQLCEDFLQAVQEFDPVKSSAMGIHTYDHRFTDWSTKNVRSMTKRLDKFEQRLRRFKKTTSLADHDRINYRLLKAEADILLQDLSKIKWHTKAPQLYAKQAIDGIYYLMISDHAPLLERLESIIARMKAVPRLIKNARDNLNKVPAPFIEIGREEFEKAIDFYQSVGSDLMNQFPGRADEILRVSTTAREAMNDFVVYLSELTPENTGTGASGTGAIGKLNYEYKLSNQHFIEGGVETLLAEAETMLSQLNQSYDEYVSYVMDNHQNGQDSIFVPPSFDRDDILAYYHWEADQLRIFCDQAQLISVPETLADLTITEIPSYLRTVVPAMQYHRGAPFDSASEGKFYVRPVPSEFDATQRSAKYRYVHRRGLIGNLVREGFPGHYLQSQLAADHPDPVRRWQRSPLFEEGWAEYCEELVYHQGLYGNEKPTRWLAILERARHQLALMIVDIRLHSQKKTIDECLGWMAEVLKTESESGRHFLRREILDISWHPTESLGRVWAKKEIQRMRQAGHDNLGVDFSLRGFHDQLLTQGALPPVLFWEILDINKQ